MSRITTPTLAAVRDAARANDWIIDRDRPHQPGRIIEARKADNKIHVRFGRRGGITYAICNQTTAQGRDKRTTVIGWFFEPAA